MVGSIDVAVSDGGGSVVRRWDRVFTTKGVFAGQIELADTPVMGDWNITVDVSGQLFSKSFQVAEYVLPKFKVDVDLPEYGTFDETTTTAIVRASYAFGGPVVGEVSLCFYPFSIEVSNFIIFLQSGLSKVLYLDLRVSEAALVVFCMR